MAHKNFAHRLNQITPRIIISLLSLSTSCGVLVAWPLTASAGLNADVLAGCNNDPYSKAARAKVKGTVKIPGSIIYSHKVSALFYPELKSKPMTPKAYSRGPTITLDADAKGVQNTVAVGGKISYQGEKVSATGQLIRWEGSFDVANQALICTPQPGTLPPTASTPAHLDGHSGIALHYGSSNSLVASRFE
jgi:hypothetical protein